MIIIKGDLINVHAWKSVSSFSKIKYCGVISQLLGDPGEGTNSSNGSAVTGAGAIVDESSRISVSDEENCEDEEDDDGEDDDDVNDGSESGISAESPFAEVTDVKQEMESEIIPDAL